MASGSEPLLTIPPGRHTLPEDFVIAHQRERLLLAAAELIAKRGYRGTTIDLIAKTAHVAPSTFYENFETKEACFLAAFDEAIVALRDGLIAAADPGHAWPGQFALGLGTLLGLLASNPARAKMCVVEAPGGGPALLARYEATLDSAVPYLRRGRELSDARIPARAEESILGGIVWVLHQHIVLGEAERLPMLLPELLPIALRPYLGPAEASRLASLEAERVLSG